MGLDPNRLMGQVPPLNYAIYVGSVTAVERLIAGGADVNLVDGTGLTALDELYEYERNIDNPELVDILLKAGTKQTFWTMLRIGKSESVNDFLAADPNLLNERSPDSLALTPLMIASKCGHVEIVALLLDGKASLRARDSGGSTALHYAAGGRQSNRGIITTMLLQSGAAVNAADKFRVTPLHLAATWGNADVTERLLKKGANSELVSKGGETPAITAKRLEHWEVLNLLKS